MIRIFTFCFLLGLLSPVLAQEEIKDSGFKKHLSICSWNLKDFGKSKSMEEISYTAQKLKDFDIVGIQEVVAGYCGSQAVALLNDNLTRLGNKWDYVVSDPTYSSSYKQERYAFLWKTSKVKKKGDAWLEEAYKLAIDREPFYTTFIFDNKEFTLVNFHAITKSKQPETEIKYFKFLPEQYPLLNLLFIGDYNCPQSHTVFNPLKKMGYQPALTGQKTTLKKSCVENECLASEFDNIFYPVSKITMTSSGVIHFYKDFESMDEANHLSDHLPVYFNFSLN
jgi:deoxyribonuclease-1-like protein